MAQQHQPAQAQRMQHAQRIREIRERARAQITHGPVTGDYALDRDQAIGVLNEALATELVCTLRYQFHYFMASGIHSQAVKQEFREHAMEEQQHAERIAERITQLGGKPQMNPDVLSGLSHSEYREGGTLAEMIREDLIAERIAVESYRDMVRFFGERDPTSRAMMEEILAKEEEHANDLTDLLFAVGPRDGRPAQELYFSDEVPRPGNGGNADAERSRQ